MTSQWEMENTADMTVSEAAWAVKNRIFALEDELEDAIWEAQRCADAECSCHDAPDRIREMIEELGPHDPMCGVEGVLCPTCAACPDCGHVGTVELSDERQTIEVCGQCGSDQ